jgi:hypothetical protein
LGEKNLDRVELRAINVLKKLNVIETIKISVALADRIELESEKVLSKHMNRHF